MRVGVVGYGRMGREVESLLRERGHEAATVRRGEAFPQACVVGIDFSRSDAVVANVRAALGAGARYVVGTTGWGEKIDEVRRLVEGAKGGLVHAANFSLGANLFYRIVRHATAVMARFPDYDPYVLERHHRHKKDAPSGTAQVLAGIVESGRGARASTTLEGGLRKGSFHVAVLRAGGIVGDHTVGFDAGLDEILLEHRARSRRAFATGAVLAAEWIATRSGFYTFEAVLDDVALRP